MRTNSLKIKEKIFFFIIFIAGILLDGCSGGKKHNETPPDPIKAYNIDYNWGPSCAHGFARPGLWADADPEVLMEWYGEDIQREVCASQENRNNKHATITWQFTSKDTRIKLKRLYPSFND